MTVTLVHDILQSLSKYAKILAVSSYTNKINLIINCFFTKIIPKDQKRILSILIRQNPDIFRWERSMSLPLDSDNSEDSLGDSKIGRRMDLALCKSLNHFASFIVDSFFICWLFYIGTAADDIWMS